MLALTHMTILTVTLYLHRGCAHRAVDFHPRLVSFFRFWSWLTTGMTARQWASVHRKHHAKCETDDDPHSPQRLGLAKVLLHGVLLYRTAIKDSETIKRYGKGTPNDALEDFYERWSSWGMASMILAEAILFGIPQAAFIGGMQLLWIPFWAAGVVNGIGHFWGYRNHESDDESRNIFPIGIIIGGEELHNNHHAFPSSAKLSIKRWELDWGWGVIRALSILGLAKVKRVAPVVERSEGEITLATLKALAACRFQAMGEAKTRLAPLVRKQLDGIAAAKGMRRKDFLRWFFLEQAQAGKMPGHDLFCALLAQEPMLASVRAALSDLSATWTRSHASAQETLEHFKEWCRAAEASGIESLATLSASLRTYGMADPA